MKITWNGTGSAWSTYYGNSSAVLEAGEQRLLFDCGHTVPARLNRMGLTLHDLDAVFISHLHGDHVYGLEEWGFRNYLIWKTRPHLLIARELVESLWQRILSGTMENMGRKMVALEDYFQVIALEVGQPCTCGPWTVEIHPVHHIPGVPAYGAKIATGGASLGFTGDSLANPGAWFYEGAAAVFHDCSFNPYFKETVHAHFEQLQDYSQPYREKTCLVHYNDDIREKYQNPDWRESLASAGLRLAEPFVPIEY